MLVVAIYGDIHKTEMRKKKYEQRTAWRQREKEKKMTGFV